MLLLSRFFKFLKSFFITEKRRVYGWKPDKKDDRDKLFKLTRPTELPPSVDLSTVMSPCYDQGNLSSCTGNAIAALIEYDQIKQNKAFDFTPSRLFIYYNERAMEGNVNQDCGAAIRDGIKAVNVNGVCKETIWPYVESKFAVKPSEMAYTEATLHKSVEYSRLDGTNLNELKACLASGFPFAFGFQVYESFEGHTIERTGILQMPRPGEPNCGGHAVACYSYDDSKQAFLVRNSWSPQWGLKGYFWMPYAYMTNPQLTSDFWTIKSIVSNKE